MHTIAIVGGGFSGASPATALLRNPPTRAARIALVERRAEIGRGVAYSTRAFPDVLNVPASGVSAGPAQPLEFVEFARRRHPAVAPGDFLPRAHYGDDLRERRVTPDPLDLGPLTGPAGDALDAAGKAIASLYHIGPMLRAGWWEATAVPELRIHLQRLAAALVSA